MSELSSKSCILYVEDDIEDVELLRYVLSQTHFPFELVHVHDGIEALAFLEKAKEFNSLPDVIFLDINLSKLDGKETFVCLKADKRFARIPVVVLSTSNAEADRGYFQKYQVPYLIKPGDVNRYLNDVTEVLGSMRFLENIPKKKENGN